MPSEKLTEELEMELERMEGTLTELQWLLAEVCGREPTTRERAAAGLFLANLYAGAESILTRPATCECRGLEE